MTDSERAEPPSGPTDNGEEVPPDEEAVTASRREADRISEHRTRTGSDTISARHEGQRGNEP